MKTKGNMIVGQSGGPTAAINATLCGVIECAMEEGIKIYGAEYGVKGIIDNNITLLNPYFEDEENRKLLKTTPSAFLGSCRLRLPEVGEDDSLYEDIFNKLEELDIRYLVYIGGNDSMDTVLKLSKYAKEHNKDLFVVGAPKTIDNDLPGTDHAPGFGSAAKYVATMVKEIARDSFVYENKSITVVEIMGRDAGWLAASSVLARCSTSDAPHYIYLSERPVSRKQLIEDINKCDAQNIVVAISEGIKDENGKYYCESKASAHDIFGHVQLAGAANVVAEIYKKEFNYKTRGIELNVPQRVAAHFASLTDINESRDVGYAVARAALSEKSGIMMGFIRNSEYNIEIVENEIGDVANIERGVPDEYINHEGNDVTEKCIQYMKPLILGEVELVMEEGLPKHLSLSSLKKGK